MNALHKVETTLTERYETMCESCCWYHQFVGTEKEARESALKMGWEFQMIPKIPPITKGGHTFIEKVRFVNTEVAYCPYCKILVKA